MANRWLYNIESKNKQNEVEEDEFEFQEEDVWYDFAKKGEDSKEEEKKIPKSVSFSWPPSKSAAAWGQEVSASPKMKLARPKSWGTKSKKCSTEHSFGLVKIPEKTNKRVPDDEDYDGDDEMVPPHEFLAMRTARERVTMVAYSMLEGIGRTLKGRDLCRLRNAVFLQTGYLD